MDLRPCPCGKTPALLSVMEGGSCKWAFVSGDCCGEWYVEFRTQYKELDSDECYALAVEAWNRTDRANDNRSA